jgi:hypothetical protein
MAHGRAAAVADQDLGIQAPTKLSETTGEETEAFAKGDDEFVEFMIQNISFPHCRFCRGGKGAYQCHTNYPSDIFRDAIDDGIGVLYNVPMRANRLTGCIPHDG